MASAADRAKPAEAVTRRVMASAGVVDPSVQEAGIAAAKAAAKKAPRPAYVAPKQQAAAVPPSQPNAYGPSPDGVVMT